MLHLRMSRGFRVPTGFLQQNSLTFPVNETVLIEQYANDRGPGRGVGGEASPEAETLWLLDVQ